MYLSYNYNMCYILNINMISSTCSMYMHMKPVWADNLMCFMKHV